MTPGTSSASQQRSPEAAINERFEASATTSDQSSRTIQSPLDLRAVELSENLKLPEVQVESAKRGNKELLKNYQIFMRRGFAIRLATTEQIVRRCLVTMSTLVS